MENRESVGKFTEIFKDLSGVAREFAFRVLRVGPIPRHISFIMDGNRRYARKQGLRGRNAGHIAGFVSLTHMLKYCRELCVEYVSLYAFGVDNFKREPEEVKNVMDLMLEKIEVTIDQAISGDLDGERIIFAGDMGLLNERLRVSAQRLAEITAENNKMVIVVYVAYSSVHEIVHAVRESCLRKFDQEEGSEDQVDVDVSDIDDCMFLRSTVWAEPELLIRTGGANRLSNFMSWQTSRCLLSTTAALWPELGLRHLVWEILKFQRMHPYLHKKKKLD